MWKLCLFILFGAFAKGQDEEFYFRGHEYRRTALGNAVDRASMKLLKETYDASGDKNIVSSPLGVLMLLSLYSTGTKGAIKDEIIELLGISDYSELTRSYSELTARFASMDPDFISVANKVCVSNQYELTDEFTDVATRQYHSDVEALNFTDAKATADAINQWANAKTRGHIKDPVSEDLFESDTAAALFNIIFFQGHWHVPFKAEETQEKVFHALNGKSVQKLTMHLLQSLFYHENEDLGARMIELPYKEHGFRMVIVLPNEVDGLPSVLEKVSQKGILEDVFRMGPAGRDIDLDMPKFDIKTKLDLKPILTKAGVGRIFTDAADGIVKGTQVAVSKAFQEAFVKVDEEGATAGAFTGFVIVELSLSSKPPPPLKFKVDRPFLYAILHEDIVLFAGTYTQ